MSLNLQDNREIGQTPRHSIASTKFDAEVLVALFNQSFEDGLNTCLQGGAVEPLYQPAQNLSDHNTIFFTRDYFASALHEAAHWCIAGQRRRRQVDYGYWYLPDGRDEQQQQAFEKVEIKPQALEWIFCCAASFPFQLSVDNLNGATGASACFKAGIWQQVQQFCKQGLPARGQQFASVLQQHFNGPNFLDPQCYQQETLK